MGRFVSVNLRGVRPFVNSHNSPVEYREDSYERLHASQFLLPTCVDPDNMVPVEIAGA